VEPTERNPTKPSEGPDALKPREQAQTVSLGFAGSLENLHGKEGVCGSSPSEGF